MYNTMATFEAKVRARQDAFLPLYAKLGNVSETAETLGMTAACVRRWVGQDAYGFAERFRAAHVQYGDYLRSIARKRLEQPSGHVGGDILLLAGIAAHGNPEWRVERGQQSAPARVQVTQIIINAPPGASSITLPTIDAEVRDELDASSTAPHPQVPSPDASNT